MIAAQNRVQGLDIADNQQNDALLAVGCRALGILIEKYGTEFHENRTTSVTAHLVIYLTFSQPDTRPHSTLFHLLLDCRLITHRSFREPSSLSPLCSDAAVPWLRGETSFRLFLFSFVSLLLNMTDLVKSNKEKKKNTKNKRMKHITELLSPEFLCSRSSAVFNRTATNGGKKNDGEEKRVVRFKH